jgi:hypothetical protein
MTTKTEINLRDIRRRGNHISLGQGYTAVEGMDGNMLTLTIRRNGKVIKSYRGSSLGFEALSLSDEDKTYLKSLAD